MSLYGSNNSANAMPKFVNQIANAGYGPNTSSNFANGSNAGTVWGITANLVSTNNVTSNKYKQPGWAHITRGTGPVVNVAVTAGGTGYANTNYWRANTGTVEANGTITTDGSGVILSVTIANQGAGFISAPTIAIVNSTGGTTGIGSNATLTATAGGRAGRIWVETLVAVGSMTTANATQDYANLP